ncbi:hypothetical protein [Tetragenococcus muriaticus]|uniref:Uncharacterized protein n=1 Tax=Tetragenococcus muriaticus 3MR10-3 TaxID=1302648 RepID=A0A091C7R9_9ENTE|nr:hypothetical protein [Tetragenococcus muriaticus]KFN92182.1 hypothetical protein TMU3MR103_0643 [Tetragenococcus muriaticus 3MR10-3]
MNGKAIDDEQTPEGWTGKLDNMNKNDKKGVNSMPIRKKVM